MPQEILVDDIQIPVPKLPELGDTRDLFLDFQVKLFNFSWVEGSDGRDDEPPTWPGWEYETEIVGLQLGDGREMDLKPLPEAWKDAPWLKQAINDYLHDNNSRFSSIIDRKCSKDDRDLPDD